MASRRRAKSLDDKKSRSKEHGFGQDDLREAAPTLLESGPVEGQISLCSQQSINTAVVPTQQQSWIDVRKFWKSKAGAAEPYQNQLNKTIKNLKGQLADEKRKLDTCQNQAKQSEAMYQRQIERAQENDYFLRQQKTQLESEKFALQIKLDAARDELAEEKSFVHELQAEKRQQEAAITRVQSAVVSKLSDNVSSELPDDTIRTQLHDIFGAVQEWARDNHASELKDRSQVKRQLVEAGILAADEKMDYRYHFDMEAELVADILLESVLNHELCAAFLSNPYFVAASALRTNETSVNENVPIALQAVLEHLQAADCAKAIAWRSDTLKLLLQDGKDSFERRAKIYASLAKGFLERWSLLTQQPVDEEEQEFLVGIVRRFGELATKLWCLKKNIAFHGLDYFSTIRFHARSHNMVAAQVVPLEDGSTRLDGKPIPLMIRPKIDASARAGGNKLGNRVIWAKGVVWISDQAKPKSRPGVPAVADSDVIPMEIEG